MTRVRLATVIALVLVLALIGATVQLAQGQRPALFPAAPKRF